MLCLSQHYLLLLHLTLQLLLQQEKLVFIQDNLLEKHVDCSWLRTRTPTQLHLDEFGAELVFAEVTGDAFHFEKKGVSHLGATGTTLVPDVILNPSFKTSSCIVARLLVSIGLGTFFYFQRLEMLQLLVCKDQVFHSLLCWKVIELVHLVLQEALG